MASLRSSSKFRILDFDIENRPLSYLGMDFTTSEITAIAASFVGEKKIHTFLLGEMNQDEIVFGFEELYNEADMVTGHYILMHDLPIINGAMTELGAEGLMPKMAHDTKVHLKGFKGLSKSQENLAAMLGLAAPKIQMNTPKWREANRLTKEGLELTRQRVEGDILQHKELREKLLELNLLRPPVNWKP